MKASPSNYWAYNDKLQPFANNLRHRMTRAEICLWKYALKARMMKGYGFRRQRPILNYIADFMNKDLNLVIEVDGASHDSPAAEERDAIRQKALESVGFTVVRFTDDEVLTNMKQVVERIESTIERIENSRSLRPPPCPPPRRGKAPRV